MGEKGEGSGGEGGGNWGERGRELGMGYPPVHPLINSRKKLQHILIRDWGNGKFCFWRQPFLTKFTK